MSQHFVTLPKYWDRIRFLVAADSDLPAPISILNFQFINQID